ncbi:MAG: aldehyde dehydrogenase family protein, partial [Cyclobacteriaceae bacterium]|nr:aldehyde dehydrogenase family protein [Cyclobacteriaceae bacterium]
MKTNLSSEIASVFKKLYISDTNSSYCTGLNWAELKGEKAFVVTTPITNEVIGHVEEINSADYEKVIQTAQEAFNSWRLVPAPQRGEIVRQYGLALRKYKLELGTLVSIECGKILQEGLGEVQ